MGMSRLQEGAERIDGGGADADSRTSGTAARASVAGGGRAGDGNAQMQSDRAGDARSRPRQDGNRLTAYVVHFQGQGRSTTMRYLQAILARFRAWRRSRRLGPAVDPTLLL